MNLSYKSTRREFIYSVAGLGAIALLKPTHLFAADEIDPKVLSIVKDSIGIDTHNHVDVPLIKDELPGPEVDLKGEMLQSGLSAICMTFAVDYQKLTEPGQAYSRFLNGISAMDVILKNNKMTRALNYADLEKAHRKQKPTVIQSVEGGHFLEGDITRMEVAYNKGLRLLGLLHDNDASVPLGDVYTNPPAFGGLTKFGADVIKECNRLGILIDLTHASDKTINDALSITEKPVVITHTGLNTQLGNDARMAKMMSPRLISKEQAKIVADTGGVVGVWTHLADSPIAFAENIRAMVDVIGVEHVCIGTDTKLTPEYRSPKQANRNPNFTHAPKEENKGKAVGRNTNVAWKDMTAGFYYTVVDSMLKMGFAEDEIKLIGGGNFCRLFDAATR